MQIQQLTIDRDRIRQMRKDRDEANHERQASIEHLKFTGYFWIDPTNIGSATDIADFEAKFAALEAQIPVDTRFVVGDHVFKVVTLGTAGETLVTGFSTKSLLDMGHCTTSQSTLEAIMRSAQRDLQEALDEYQIDDNAVYVNMEVFNQIKGEAAREGDFSFGDRVLINQKPYEIVGLGTPSEVLVNNWSTLSLREVI